MSEMTFEEAIARADAIIGSPRETWDRLQDRARDDPEWAHTGIAIADMSIAAIGCLKMKGEATSTEMVKGPDWQLISHAMYYVSGSFRCGATMPWDGTAEAADKLLAYVVAGAYALGYARGQYESGQ